MNRETISLGQYATILRDAGSTSISFHPTKQWAVDHCRDVISDSDGQTKAFVVATPELRTGRALQALEPVTLEGE